MKISEHLESLSLISGKKLKEIFDELYQDILVYPYESPSTFVRDMWSRYTSENPSLNGKVFEAILATIFYREGIVPMFVQAHLAFVPNVEFDFVAYSKEHGPVVLSAKTSLRERYKQADLEGMMLRQVHRKSKSYLITLHEAEAKNVNNKIAIGEVLGLDDVVVASNSCFDDLIEELKTYNYYLPEKISVISGSKVIT